jgi:predicted SprT family Zn-dependent metalloprotease
MKSEIPVKNPDELLVSDRVKFHSRDQALFGHVARKGRHYAYVVCDDRREFRVPYAMLHKIDGAAAAHVQTKAEKLRGQFHAHERVSFDLDGQTTAGVISRLNPKRAHVVCDNGKEYQVPYAMLRLETARIARPLRGEDALAGIAAQAKALFARHQLTGWSFQFDNGRKRAGCCNYGQRVISVSHEYARQASDEDITDTLLHEIAHALVGQSHGHDEVWRVQALALGCSGMRCHDLQFTPPRYIVRCATGCWTATAERRQRGAICRQCRGAVEYQTYTEERWAAAPKKRN